MTRTAAVALLVVACSAQAADELMVAPFSAMQRGADLPRDWRMTTWPGAQHQTRFSLVQDGGTVVLRAQADRASAGLMKELRIDPRQYPILAWRWKISHLLKHSDIRATSGDDFPARIFVTFDVDPATLPFGERVKLHIGRLFYGPDLPRAALCYVWDSKAPAGAIVPNAYSERVRMVVIRSGPSDVGRWVNEQRNVLEDYRRAFGSEAPPIIGIAVSSDTDSTGEYAEAYFGDIAFRREGESL
ncbi:MAG: DUF3047 domain-containing protein [Chromatiales bacterium]